MDTKKYQESDWLEYLQRESWHLELLVSGFSIFLLMQAYEGLTNLFDYLNLHIALNPNLNGLIRTFLGILILGSIVLMCNLVLHVFIRGFWIGTVGLRSVQENVNISKLGYSEFFTEKLKERVLTLDKILARLDTLASVIFSFTFLVVFMLLSLFLYFSVISLFIYGFTVLVENPLTDGLLKKILTAIAMALTFVWIAMGFIYMVDTLSLGFFKKYQRLSKLFFPVYRVMGVITLAGLYRSIYYSLINRFSKSKIRLALCFYVLLFIMIPFFKYDQYIYYPDNGSAIKLNDHEYDDVRLDGANIWFASIPSQFIDDSFLPLFVRYRPQHNALIKEICDDWQPLKKDGVNSGIKITSQGLNLGDAYVRESEPEKALECLSDFYSISLDSKKLDLEYYLYIHPNNEERGIITVIDIDSLSRGKHVIDISYKEFNTQEVLVDSSYSSIPFWKE